MKQLRIISSELALGALVAVLSVLVALAAYQSGIYDSQEGDLNVEGQKLLTDSNSMYLEANQFIIYDFQMYDGWWINDQVNQENAEYYQASFSEDLTASMDREGGPFDEAYYEAMYADADGQYSQAAEKFDAAQKAGDKADGLQLVVLIFAVGLALAAYGGLLDSENNMRFLFSIGSTVALIFGLVLYFQALA